MISKMPEETSKSKALSQYADAAKVLCELFLSETIGFPELYSGLVQIKSRLEKAELQEIETDYKESLKDCKE